jgi:hypothetical protein
MPAPGLDPSASGLSPWLARLVALAGGIGGWLSRPRVRLAVTGVVLVVIAGLVVTSSAWTLPLVIVGVLMVAIAWIGSRLDGHFVVEWGESGTQVAFRAEIKSAQHPHLQTRVRHAPAAARVLEVVRDGAEVVEGEAHTVEVDIGELKALIAAAEADESRTDSSDAAANGSPTRRPAHR